ncbi:MAG: small nuclear ribonucleoprotein [Candidatus Aenigmatarchaeota archaeon]|nr:MAG: small nuclear ribonucleoprotein [Candidatus Aenigmarchaeota archaeon]
MTTNRPLDALDQAKGKRIIIRLKNGDQIAGVLKAFDLHINVWLEDAEQINSEKKIKLGTVIVRGDNILFASPE